MFYWVADVYDNLETNITLWIASIPKVAILFFLYNIKDQLINTDNTIKLAAILSLIVGSIALGSQYKIKRFIAFSSVSHIGFILLALENYLAFNQYV